MKIEDRFIDRIRGFDLLERLSPTALDALLDRSASILTFEPGQLIYAQGQEDPYINYLLEGSVERTRNGLFELVIDYDKERRTRPLDAMAQKRHTVHAASSVTILRIVRRDLERAYLDAASGDRDAGLEVTDIGSDTTQDWRTRLLSSELFTRLAAPNIQSVFDRMVELRASRGQEIIRQGETGGDYYVIQSGSCEVVRSVGTGGHRIHLANLGPGDGFGEEAAISGAPRNASVRMTTDGRLMRLDKADFLELVVRPLVRSVNQREARYLSEQGFVLVDTRTSEAFRRGSLERAVSIPLHLIRSQARELDKSASYIICGEEPGRALLGAFHFVERGLDACYLEEPISQLLPKPRTASGEPAQGRPAPVPPAQPETPAMSKNTDGNGSGADTRGVETAVTPRAQPATQSSAASAEGERVPRDEFTDTITGQELADIIDELYRQRQEIEASSSFSLAEESAESPPLVERAVDAGGARSAVCTADDLVKEIVRDIDLKLSNYIKACISSHQEALTEKLKEHAAHIERVAQEKVKQHEQQVRAQFEEAYAARERKLKEDYDRLTRLANRLAQQKADIQTTRRKLAEMLQTANRVNQAVYRAGNALVEQVDHLGQLEDEGNVH